MLELDLLKDERFPKEFQEKQTKPVSRKRDQE